MRMLKLVGTIALWIVQILAAAAQHRLSRERELRSACRPNSPARSVLQS
jgi:hypothetical protein